METSDISSLSLHDARPIYVVRVTDGSANTSNASVTVQAPVAALAISPESASVINAGSQTFSASVGATLYTFSIVTNNYCGTINASTAAYVAGFRGPVTDVV